LVNPYFPSKQLFDEMKAYFKDLISEYPSGLQIQNLLAGKLFTIEETNILTGNGAAELIRAITPMIHDSVGIIYPTFNEYPESFSNNATIVPFYPENIHYDINQLINWSRQCNTMVVINPDNPSGNYIPSKDMIRLLDILKSHNKKLILDESFIDFCDFEEYPSLLQQDILEEYPNLIVVKSISKSYGVPGLRLGILACGDSTIIENIRKNISIWNINSLGEYFLQIIGKYIKDYRLACQFVSVERRRFKKEFERTGLFDIYPSQANYILCRCKNSTADKLAKYLYESHSIFIKDLTGKKGIPDNTWIRLAVRGKEDDNFLVEKLFLYS
jgi:histidinol-phosphate/aromatic aminotransferase/cobyric acid decarboxylase-like protein